MAAERDIPRELQTLIAKLQDTESEEHKHLLHDMFILRAMLVGSNEREQANILNKFSFKIAGWLGLTRTRNRWLFSEKLQAQYKHERVGTDDESFKLQLQALVENYASSVSLPISAVMIELITIIYEQKQQLAQSPKRTRIPSLFAAESSDETSTKNAALGRYSAHKDLPGWLRRFVKSNKFWEECFRWSTVQDEQRLLGKQQQKRTRMRLTAVTAGGCTLGSVALAWGFLHFRNNVTLFHSLYQSLSQFVKTQPQLMLGFVSLIAVPFVLGTPFLLRDQVLKEREETAIGEHKTQAEEASIKFQNTLASVFKIEFSKADFKIKTMTAFNTMTIEFKGVGAVVSPQSSYFDMYKQGKPARGRSEDVSTWDMNDSSDDEEQEKPTWCGEKFNTENVKKLEGAPHQYVYLDKQAIRQSMENEGIDEKDIQAYFKKFEAVYNQKGRTSKQGNPRGGVIQIAGKVPELFCPQLDSYVEFGKEVKIMNNTARIYGFPLSADHGRDKLYVFCYFSIKGLHGSGSNTFRNADRDVSFTWPPEIEANLANRPPEGEGAAITIANKF